MPRIEEYLPQTEGQGPVGGLDPRTEAVGRIGAGIEKVGSTLEQAGQAIYRRQEQAEVSGISADMSQARTDWQQRLIQETQDGTVDADKIKQDYADFTDQAGQNIKTAAGRDYFNRLSSRLGATIMTQAAHGQSQVAGAKATADFQTELNSNSSSLMQDPSSFDDVNASTQEGIDARVQTGGLPAAKAEGFKTMAGRENAKAAIRGWANLGDTGQKNADGTPVDGPDIAKHILDSGDLDKYLDGDQKAQMYAYIDHAKNAKVAAQAQAERLQKVQEKQQSDDWYTSTAGAYANGTLTPAQVLNSPLPGHEQWAVIDKIKTQAKQKSHYDPQTVTEMTDRMVLPDDDPRKINSPQELLGKVPPQDYQRILGWYNKSPQGQALNANRKLLIDYAKSKILMADPTNPTAKVGYDRLSQFTVDLQHQEKTLADQKQPISSLYDPSSPNYFGKSLDAGKYQKTLKELMDDTALRMRQNAVPKTTSPGNPPGAAPVVRNPGESPDDFLKRKKAKGG